MREIGRISAECRLHAKGLRPGLALLRTAAALNSLAESLVEDAPKNSPLTKREQEILFHVSQGFTNRDIASAFNISEKTIEFHLKSVFRKTDASSRTEAVKNAITRGWI
jgi:DNA-binding NarL/FixJ family response regulator